MRSGGKQNHVKLLLICCLAGACLMVLPPSTRCQQGKSFRAVIIKGAGYLPGTEKPTDPDAITHATSEPGNTHVFCDQLVKKMAEKKINASVIDFSECVELDCLDSADMVILAGPSYMRKFPEQLERLFPKFKGVIARHPKTVCSCLVSANYTWRGVVTMVRIDEELKKAGARTVPGVVFNSDVIQQEIDEDLKDFVDALIAKSE